MSSLRRAVSPCRRQPCSLARLDAGRVQGGLRAPEEDLDRGRRSVGQAPDNAITRKETNERWANPPWASGPRPGRGIPRWRSLAALHPDLAAQLHPTRNRELAATSSRRATSAAPMPRSSSRNASAFRCGSAATLHFMPLDPRRPPGGSRHWPAIPLPQRVRGLSRRCRARPPRKPGLSNLFMLVARRLRPLFFTQRARRFLIRMAAWESIVRFATSAGGVGHKRVRVPYQELISQEG
jgi:hypothetical protein